jgi:hypothetical protein
MFDRRSAIIWVSFTILSLLLLRNAFFAHPVADDYCYAVNARSLGSWVDAVVHEYYAWGGRYSSTALMSIFALNFDLVKDYWLIPVTLVLFTILAFYVFFSSLSFVAGAKTDWLNWGAFGFCIYIATIPAFSEMFYFMAAGITYTFGYGLLLIIWGILLRVNYSQLSKFQYFAYALLLTIFVFLVPGFSEVAGLLLVLTFMFVVVFTFSTRGRNKYLHLTAFLVSVLCLTIVASAPGNEVRMAQLGGGGIKWLTPFYGLYKAIGVLFLTILIMYILTANSLIAELAQRLSIALSEKLGTVTAKERVVFSLAVLIFYVAVYSPSYWAAGSSPEGRTKTILYILPLILWVPTISIAQSFKKEKNAIIRWVLHRKPYMEKVSIVGLFVLVITMNVKDIVLDAYARGSSYNEQLLNRYDEITKAKHSGMLDVTVDELQDLPTSLYFGDILDDPEHWRNQCYKNYFELSSIRIRP